MVEDVDAERKRMESLGVALIHPPACLAHPFDDGTAVLLRRSIDETANGLGEDAAAWRRLFGRLAGRWDDLACDILRPMSGLPRHPFLLAGFGLGAIRSARGLAGARLSGVRARALFAGLAAGGFMTPIVAASFLSGFARSAVDRLPFFPDASERGR